MDYYNKRALGTRLVIQKSKSDFDRSYKYFTPGICLQKISGYFICKTNSRSLTNTRTWKTTQSKKILWKRLKIRQNIWVLRSLLCHTTSYQAAFDTIFLVLNSSDTLVYLITLAHVNDDLIPTILWQSIKFSLQIYKILVSRSLQLNSSVTVWPILMKLWMHVGWVWESDIIDFS